MLGNRYGWSQDKGEKIDALLNKSFKKASLYFSWVMQFTDR
jgi:hypothetical protein